MKELPEHMTIKESYAPAMGITDPQEAVEYLEALIQRDMKYFGTSREEAEKVERTNLGYYAGYYDTATRERVERLFNCRHPFFGKVSDGVPTIEQALEAGRKAAG